MYELKAGTRQGANEIYFDSIPSESIRESLKAIKMRWNGAKKCWYGFVSEEAIKNAIDGASAQTEAPMDALKDYKQDYMEILKSAEENWDYWESYYQKKISAAYKIGRYIVGFDKPSIKTSFCFGYGYCGLSTIEDEERASNMAHHARTNEEYFVKENLKSFDEILNRIAIVKMNRLPMEQQDWTCARSGRDVKDVIFTNHYCNNSDVIDVCFTTYNSEYEGLKNCIDHLTDEELNTYEKAVKQERAKMEKRLKTYLKRYGLSKLNTWSYLSD